MPRDVVADLVLLLSCLVLEPPASPASSLPSDPPWSDAEWLEEENPKDGTEPDEMELDQRMADERMTDVEMADVEMEDERQCRVDNLLVPPQDQWKQDIMDWVGWEPPLPEYVSPAEPTSTDRLD